MEKYYINKDSGFTLPDTPCIVPHKAYVQLIHANNIISEAHTKARTIEDEAKDLYESQRVRGYTDGINQGKEEIAEQMLDLMAERITYLEKIESSVVELVMEALNKILDEMPPQERVVNTIKRAIVYVRNQHNVTLRVHPDNEVYARQALDSMQIASHSSIKLFSDKRLQFDACVLETELGVIDATLSTQLQNIERALMKNLGSKA
ncbi:MAG: HrpE/YscL family type III secretion apparatus protein [Pseudomonadota bacterium]